MATSVPGPAGRAPDADGIGARRRATPQLAASQAAALTRLQLLALGWTDHEINAQVRARRWQVPVPGVLVLFTGPLPRRTRLWVAVLHGGDLAVLSHETAAEAYGLREVDPEGTVHVLAPHDRKIVAPPWIVVHRTRLPQPQRARELPGLPPVTSPEDTVLDLVDQSRRRRTAVGWVLGACQVGVTTPDRLRAAMGRRRRIRHRPLVKELCADVRDGVQSPLERRYYRDVEKAHGLPRARRQKPGRLRGARVFRDVDYDEHGLLVELDGRRGHADEEGAFRDRRRDNAAAVGGRTTLRFGWTDVAEDPCGCAAQVAAVLRRRGWRGELRRCGPACRLPSQWGSS